MKRAILATAACAATALTLALSSAGAQSDPTAGTLELHQRERDVSTAFVDNPPRRRESPGDSFTISGPVRDSSGARVGRAVGVFTQTDRRSAQGTVTVLLSQGRIVIAGAVTGNAPNGFAIAGGSGAYEGASGTALITTKRNRTEMSFRFEG